MIPIIEKTNTFFIFFQSSLLLDRKRLYLRKQSFQQYLFRFLDYKSEQILEFIKKSKLIMSGSEEKDSSSGEGKKQVGGKHWISKRRLEYLWFLYLFGKKYEAMNSRREDKIFVHMQKFVIGKTSKQCRTHSQKIWKRNTPIAGVLKKISSEFYEERSISNEHLIEEIRTHIYSLTQVSSSVREEFLEALEQLDSRLQEVTTTQDSVCPNIGIYLGNETQVKLPERESISIIDEQQFENQTILSQESSVQSDYLEPILQEEEEEEQIPIQGKKKKTKKKKQKKQNYKWKIREGVYFYWFVELKLHEFFYRGEHQKTKSYFHMSKFMKKRSASQCRSRHQKMLEPFQMYGSDKYDVMLYHYRKYLFYDRNLTVEHLKMEIRAYIAQELEGNIAKAFESAVSKLQWDQNRDTELYGSLLDQREPIASDRQSKSRDFQKFNCESTIENTSDQESFFFEKEPEDLIYKESIPLDLVWDDFLFL